MMNYIWTFMILFSVICALFSGKMPEVTQAIPASGAQAVELSLKLLGMMCLWCGIMNIAEKSGLCKFISRLLQPIIDFLLPGIKYNSKARNAVSMNVTANLLGLGNAATPLGINAIKEMKLQNGSKNTVTADMTVFVVMNTAALKIIPSTVAALRASAGAEKPMDIIFCVWISSALSLFFAVSLAKLFGRGKK